MSHNESQTLDVISCGEVTIGHLRYPSHKSRPVTALQGEQDNRHFIALRDAAWRRAVDPTVRWIDVHGAIPTGNIRAPVASSPCLSEHHTGMKVSNVILGWKTCVRS